MTEVEQLEERIRSLPAKELALLRQWFYEFDHKVWDRQIQADFQAGKFDGLVEAARKEFAEGKAREL